jgi:hypothetical protein
MPRSNFTKLPQLDTKNNKWIWPDIKVEKPTNKIGVGIFARKKLLKGLLIPYGGHVINHIEYARMKKSTASRDMVTGYICNNEYSEDKMTTINFVDAHPSRYKNLHDNAPADAWIGALANEPASEVESVNAILVRCDEDDDILQYKDILKSEGSIVFLQLTKTVERNQEILTDYGYDIQHYRRLGYFPSHVVLPSSTTITNNSPPPSYYINKRLAIVRKLQLQCKGFNDLRCYKKLVDKRRRKKKL